MYGIFLSQVIGIPFGVLIAIAANHVWISMRQEAEKKQLLDLIAATLKRNASLLESMGPRMSPENSPLLTVDTVCLESIAAKKYEVIDIALCGTIDGVLYDLKHLAGMIESLKGIYFTSEHHSDPVFTSPWTALSPLLVQQLKIAQEIAAEAVDRALVKVTEAQRTAVDY